MLTESNIAPLSRLCSRLCSVLRRVFSSLLVILLMFSPLFSCLQCCALYANISTNSSLILIPHTHIVLISDFLSHVRPLHLLSNILPSRLRPNQYFSSRDFTPLVSVRVSRGIEQQQHLIGSRREEDASA